MLQRCHLFYVNADNILMNVIRRVLFSSGLILTGLLISSLDLHDSLHALRTYQSEIFYTNCLVLFAPQNFAIQTLPAVPPQCTTVEWLLPAGLIASGLVVLLFGFTKTACFFSAANLLAYLAFYLNTRVDSAFGVYAHALEVLVCGVGLIILFLKQAERKEEQVYRGGAPMARR